MQKCLRMLRFVTPVMPCSSPRLGACPSFSAHPLIAAITSSFVTVFPLFRCFSLSPGSCLQTKKLCCLHIKVLLHANKKATSVVASHVLSFLVFLLLEASS